MIIMNLRKACYFRISKYYIRKYQPMQQEEENNKKQLKFYRPADVQRSFFGGESFDIRFDSLRNSLVNANFFSKAGTILNWKLNPTIKNLSEPTDEKQLEEKLPILQPKFQTFQDKIAYTWIGHSTAVISIGKKVNIIIDPVFSERCSPFGFVGPKRFRRPACTIDKLPIIHAVFVSHDHYDHLDTQALQKLHYKDYPLFFAGLNSEDVFPKGSKLTVLDWTKTQSIRIEGQKYEITFVPVCHWSQRSMGDKLKRLWGGFVIKTPKGKKIFYAGDTGYCQIFKQLGEVFGGFDLSILPIGAYQPRDILKAQHINPQQAVIIHKEIKSKKSVGVHWGTFPLGNQHWCQARENLQTAVEKHELKKDEFITVSHGSCFQIDY